MKDSVHDDTMTSTPPRATHRPAGQVMHMESYSHMNSPVFENLEPLPLLGASRYSIGAGS